MALKGVFGKEVCVDKNRKVISYYSAFPIGCAKDGGEGPNFKAIVLSIIKLNSNSSSTSTLLSLYLKINMTYTLHTQSI